MTAPSRAPTPIPSVGTLDYYYRIYESLFSQSPRIRQSMILDHEEEVCNMFDPEPIIDHCFKQFKQKDFYLPESRRRIIIVPQRQEQVPVDPTLPPQAPSPPIPSYKALEDGDIQEPPEDSTTWLNRRLKLREELESFGDVKKWLENKPSITPSEAKVLHMIHKEQGAQMDLTFHTPKATRKKNLQVSHKSMPQLRLPKPSALSDMYSYLHRRKVKVLELFHKTDQNGKQRISREDFIMTLKAAGVPLNAQEMEDIVIYLGSLGKHNTITMEILANTYNQWSLTQQKSTLNPGRENYNVDKERVSLKSLLCKQKDLMSHSPKTNLLTVPEVSIETEARPMSLEEMEEVGKRYRERKRQHKITIPSITYMECCRLVRCGKEPVDAHCLPSTIPGEMEELINVARKDAFLVYLQCWKLCESYGLPLTEEILMRALLYPGDKIIFQRDQMRPIRQPGGFYSDWSITPKLPQCSSLKKSGAKRKSKRMHFKDFERFARKLKKKSRSGSLKTDPNSFWPGHLLDKLRLYLPTVSKDNSLALFSCVQHEHQVYPAIYHPNHWWPLRNTSYMTCAHYDSTKVYYIN